MPDDIIPWEGAVIMEFSNFTSICIYILIVIAGTYYCYLADKYNKKLYLLITYLIIALPAALRYCVGIDYKAYLDLYNRMISYGSVDTALKAHIVERSFLYLSFFSNQIFHSAWFVFAFYAIFTQLFMLLGMWNFRKYVSPSLMMFIYLCGYYWRTYNIFRQALAVAIIFFGFRYIKGKKLVRFLVCVLIAGVFHKTALLAVFVYLYYNFQLKYANKLVTYIMPVALILFLERIMNFFYSLEIFSNYGNYYSIVNMSIVSFGTIIEIALFLFYYFVKWKKKTNIPSDVRVLMDKATIANMTFYFLLYRLFFASRIGLYFTTFNFVAMASIHKKGKKIDIRAADKYDCILIGYYIFSFIRCMARNSYGQLPYAIWG